MAISVMDKRLNFDAKSGRVPHLVFGYTATIIGAWGVAIAAAAYAGLE